MPTVYGWSVSIYSISDCIFLVKWYIEYGKWRTAIYGEVVTHSCSSIFGCRIVFGSINGLWGKVWYRYFVVIFIRSSFTWLSVYLWFYIITFICGILIMFMYIIKWEIIREDSIANIMIVCINTMDVMSMFIYSSANNVSLCLVEVS